MKPLELALRLVALRQASLTDRPEARSLRITYRDELALWASWLQVHPDQLTGLISVLTTEIARSRNDLGLPVLPSPAWSVPTDPAVTLTAAAGIDAATIALTDRLAAQLAELDGWTLTLDLGGGETITARPARAQ